MKYFITFLFTLFSLSQSFSQADCQPYVPTEKGTIWEITNYSKKGKETGKIIYELVDKVVSGKNVTFTIRNKTYDKKGKEIFSNTYQAVCKDGIFYLDMAAKMHGASMAAYKDMDFTIDATEFKIPDMDAPAGTRLPDGSMKVKIDSGPLALNMDVQITDRQVDKKEQITTPAGTFDCLVMSQIVKTKMVVNVEASTREWYTEEVGMVRSETYHKNGKLTGYSELTRLEKK